MAFRTSSITMNNGSVLDIGSINNATRLPFTTFIGTTEYISMPYQVTWYYNEIGNTIKPTAINLGNYATEIGSALTYSDYNYYRSILTSHKTYDEVHSPEYLLAKEALNNGVVWLWGDIDSGGVFIYKESGYNINNPVVDIGGIEGFYEEEVLDGENLYYYNFIYSSHGTSRMVYNSRVVFFWDSESDNNNLGFVYDIPSNNPAGDDQWQWCEAETPLPNPFTHWTSEVEQPTIIDVLERPEFVKIYNWVTAWQQSGNFFDVTVDMPSIIFREYGGSQSHNTFVRLNTSFPDDLKISGDMLGSDFSDEDPMPPAYYGDGGGFGSYPTDNANIGDTNASQFAIDAINSGFVTLYKPTKQAIVALNDFLFSDSITEDIAAKLKQLIANPLEYILFIAMCHYQPTTTTSEEMKYCGMKTGVFSEVIANQYHMIDCGWVTVEEPSRSFLDYGSNTKIKVYLPYIGTHEISSEDCMGGRIHITYWIDQLTGSCIAQVRCQRTSRVRTDVSINDVLYEFTGNCFVTLPLCATDWRGTFNAMLQFVGGVSGIAGAIASKDIGGVTSGIGQLADAAMSKKVSVNRTGQAGSSYGYMGHQKPYLIYERPIPNLPYNFGRKKGYMSNYGANLSSLKGYTEIESETLRIDSFPGITDEEMNLLKQMCASGIVL